MKLLCPAAGPFFAVGDAEHGALPLVFAVRLWRKKSDRT
jgi:hypothetical protein